MGYKVLAMDMDGTLLKNNKTISEKNLNSLKEAQAKGIEIIICTGRPFGTLKPYLEELGFPCWLVTNNGAVIRNKEKEVVKIINLNKTPTLKVLEILNSEEIYYHATDPYFAFINSYWQRVKALQKFIKKREISRFNSWVESLWAVFFSNTHRRVNLFQYVAGGGQISSIFIHSSDLNRLAQVRQLLEKIEGIQITSSERHNIEILDGNATKGLALHTIVEKMGINPQDVIAVGDNHNDLSMIQYAGLGVAMGNSEEEVLACADYITKSNEEDGISFLIEKMIEPQYGNS